MDEATSPISPVVDEATSPISPVVDEATSPFSPTVDEGHEPQAPDHLAFIQSQPPRPQDDTSCNTAKETRLLATIWCIGLIVALVAYLIWLACNSDYDAGETALYIPTYLMGRLLWRVHFLNDPPPEIATGGILVANHRSSVDPFFVQLAARRRVHWMVAKEYCQHVIFGKILGPCKVIPTNRSGVDTASTKQAIRLAKSGRLVGMFPEGQLNKTPDPLCPIRSGAALVATRGNVPLIPLYIQGSPYNRTVWSPVFMPANVAITFGTAIHPEQEAEHNGDEQSGLQRSDSSAGDLQQSERLIIAWAKQVVAMAGRPEFPVKLATKRTRRKSRV